jgi:hypothetical protein
MDLNRRRRMGMLVWLRACGMGVEMGVGSRLFRAVEMEPSSIAKSPQPDANQRDPHRYFRPPLHREGHADPAPSEERSRDQDCRCMPDTPADPERDRSTEAGVPTHECRDRDHVIHFESVHRTQGKRRYVGSPETGHVSFLRGA